MLDISLPTLDRVMARSLVDRSTLIHAFSSVGVQWDDAFSESLKSDFADVEHASESDPRHISNAARQSRGKRSLWVAVGLVAATIAVANLWTRSRGDWTAKYDAALAAATHSFQTGHYDLADSQLADVMGVAEQHATSRDLSAALKLRGDISAARGKLPAASEYYRAAISYGRLRKRPAWPSVHEALGVVQIRLGDFDSARENLDFALNSYTLAKDRNGIAEVTRDKGCLALAMDQPLIALDWFAKSLDTLATTHEPDLVMDVRGERAMALSKLGRLHQARSELDTCLEHWSKSSHQRWIGLTEMRLGEVESKLGNLSSAHDRIARASVMFAKVGDEARLKEAESLLKAMQGKP